MTNLEWANKYCSLGWKIMPIYWITNDGHCSCSLESCSSPGKHPMLKHGVLEASNYTTIARSWWKKTPQGNLAVATGEESDMVVVDIDFKSGGAMSYTDMLTKYKLPNSVMCKTGAGLHLYFKYAEGIKNKVGIASGIDVRSDGGYVLIPPSNHYTGNIYSWIKDPWTVEMATMPDWLYEFIIARGESESEEDDYADIIPEGRRNNAMHHFGCSMRNKGFSKKAIRAALLAENSVRCIPPLSDDEIDLVVSSVCRYDRGESGLGVWY